MLSQSRNPLISIVKPKEIWSQNSAKRNFRRNYQKVPTKIKKKNLVMRFTEQYQKSKKALATI